MNNKTSVKRGRPKYSAPIKTQINIRLDNNLLAIIQEAGLEKTSVIHQALHEWLNAHGYIQGQAND